ncbi:MAG: helix-hairpin-helix domain-containing protein [Chitinispirillales bacterium]|jgi:competence protein ComEA|nr:helix-hairpin-helix domain-containing protein [Chitinispirillales bacterium]
MKLKNPIICKSVHCRIIAFWIVGIAGLWTASIFKDAEKKPNDAIVVQVFQEEQNIYFDGEIPDFQKNDKDVVVKKEEKTKNKPANETVNAAKKRSKIVNINTANIDELVLIPGIGQTTAQKIIDNRKENGKFLSVEDLKKISGISEKKFESLKNFVKL